MEIKDEEAYFMHLNSYVGCHDTNKIVDQVYQLVKRSTMSIKGLSIISPLNVPQQKNGFDCGIYVLHYVEDIVKYINKAPKDVSSKNLMDTKNYLTAFSAIQCKKKRSKMFCEINKLI